MASYLYGYIGYLTVLGCFPECQDKSCLKID